MGILNKHHPNVLVVEGNDDKYAVIELMGFHTEWPDDRDKCPVYVEACNGVEEILADRFLDVWLKSPRLEKFGILLDEDDTVGGRHQRRRQLCSKRVAGLPDVLPQEGLVVHNPGGPRFGVWIMPDNRSLGDLETFLRGLVPITKEPLWRLASDTVVNAKNLGALFKDSHLTKACLYTWLAWQDPPGQSPGRALTQKLLDPHASDSEAFVRWFKNLYRLPDL